MFSVVSVYHPVHRVGPQVTINHDALDLTIQDPQHIQTYSAWTLLYRDSPSVQVPFPQDWPRQH